MNELYPIHDEFEIDVAAVRKYMAQRDALLSAAKEVLEPHLQDMDGYSLCPICESREGSHSLAACHNLATVVRLAEEGE